MLSEHKCLLLAQVGTKNNIHSVFSHCTSYLLAHWLKGVIHILQSYDAGGVGQESVNNSKWDMRDI